MSIQGDAGIRCMVEALADEQETARLRGEHLKGSGLAGDMTVEALPTVYRGTTFRSALEASWAATLDSLGITWEYEPETVTLPSGAKYLPDFRLPDIGVWLEVKGPGVPRVEKAIEFGQVLACDCPSIRGITRCSCRWPGGELVLIGHPPVPFSPWADESYDHWPSRSRLRLARRHGGHLKWTSTRKRRAWLARCPDCQHATWFDLGCCRACRGPLVGAHGVHSGAEGFEFIRISGAAVPGDHDTTSTEEAADA
ncbi:hypothetical protein [Streptomyces bugieae]|uniref:Uncharacterized protein n=1 Tax=Streptomyces bugieae TaxID=3098223 RepID=A0ABU7NL46_9ACTN|nr:hypothetical protein [Streptomyces sp. DSM 41528]